MNKSRAFEIHHVGLAPGLHSFEYHLEDSFFEQFAETPFTNAKLDVSLELDKKTSLFILNFSINGTLQTLCDRCGDEFELKVWDEFELVAKLTDPEKVEELNEDDNEVVYFSRTDNSINISTLLYEQVILSLPMQIIHPDDTNGKSTCNAKAIQLLEALQTKTEEAKQEQNNTNRSLQEQLNKLKIK